MLRPTKHSHPDRTVINVAALLLTRLKSRRVEEYDALLTLNCSADLKTEALRYKRRPYGE